MENGEILDSNSLLKIATEETNKNLTFDSQSSLYFDAEKDLYFDPESQIYFDYKDASYYRKDFLFVSTVARVQHLDMY